MSNGHRWSKFWWQDWRGDDGLHECSLAARGLWMEILCLAHEGTPVGHVTIAGKPATVAQIARKAGCPERQAEKLLAELEEQGVFSRTEAGTIYSRRMCRDAEQSEAGREHVARRWNGHKDPNTPPNRVPITQASRDLNSDPKSPPITRGRVSEAETESKKVSVSNNLLSFPVSAPVRETGPSVAEIETASSKTAPNLKIVGRSELAEKPPPEPMADATRVAFERGVVVGKMAHTQYAKGAFQHSATIYKTAAEKLAAPIRHARPLAGEHLVAARRAAGIIR